MEIKLPQDVKFIIDKIYEYGFEAFIVGGCVRDSILGIVPNDYDITTNAKPEEIIGIFKGYKIIDNGIKHGTVGVIINKEVYEITTYRIEGEYENNRRPKEVEFTSNIVEDLKRRDFTINAMAYNNRCGLIDRFQGLEDINSRSIKTVGNPDERFREDGLRIIRAIRFSAKLDFEIEGETLSSIYRNANLIRNISKERITDELNKIILSLNPQKFTLLYKTSILKYLNIYNNLNDNEFEALEKELIMLSMCDYKIEKRLLMLEYLITTKLIHNLNNIEKNIEKYYKEEIQSKDIVNNLRYSKYISDYCNTLIKYMFVDELSLDLVQIKKILNKIGSEKLIQVFGLKKIYYRYKMKNDVNCNEINDRYKALISHTQSISKIIENKECYKVAQLEVDGTDLKKIGYTGIDIGQKLNYLLEEVIKNPNLNNKESLIKLLN